MTSPNEPAAIAHSPRPGPERRRDGRRAMQGKASLTILDGPGASTVHEVMTRDLAQGGLSFLLKDPLSVGQTCRIDLQSHPPQSYLCEVVRSRPLSTGKHEMAVQFRGRA